MLVDLRHLGPTLLLLVQPTQEEIAGRARGIDVHGPAPEGLGRRDVSLFFVKVSQRGVCAWPLLVQGSSLLVPDAGLFEIPLFVVARRCHFLAGVSRHQVDVAHAVRIEGAATCEQVVELSGIAAPVARSDEQSQQPVEAHRISARLDDRVPVPSLGLLELLVLLRRLAKADVSVRFSGRDVERAGVKVGRIRGRALLGAQVAECGQHPQIRGRQCAGLLEHPLRPLRLGETPQLELRLNREHLRAQGCGKRLSSRQKRDLFVHFVPARLEHAPDGTPQALDLQLVRRDRVERVVQRSRAPV